MLPCSLMSDLHFFDIGVLLTSLLQIKIKAHIFCLMFANEVGNCAETPARLQQQINVLISFVLTLAWKLISVKPKLSSTHDKFAFQAKKAIYAVSIFFKNRLDTSYMMSGLKTSSVLLLAGLGISV